MAKLIIRVGDIVDVKEKSGKSRQAMVRSIQGWYVARGMMSVRYRNGGLDSLVLSRDCTLRTKREDLKKWWLWC